MYYTYKRVDHRCLLHGLHTAADFFRADSRDVFLTYAVYPGLPAGGAVPPA